MCVYTVSKDIQDDGVIFPAMAATMRPYRGYPLIVTARHSAREKEKVFQCFISLLHTPKDTQHNKTLKREIIMFESNYQGMLTLIQH